MIGTELLNAMYGNPLSQMMPQNPNPMAPKPQPAPGAPPSLTTAPGTPSPVSAPGQPAAPQQSPPSGAAASPPDLANLYLQLMQRERSANEIDRGLAMMAGAFAAPGTQGAIMNSAMPRQDAGGEMNNLLSLMMMQRQMQAMPAVAQSLGLDPNVAMAIGPQGVQKLVEAQAQSRIAIGQQKAEQQNKDVEEFRNTGVQDFSAADQKLRETESGVNQLLSNMPATMKALAAPELLTTSKAAAWLPPGVGYDEATKQQAIAIQKLEAGLTGESLQNVKNVRNQREFNTLGEALTAGLNVNNGPQGVQDALNSIKQRMGTTHANVYAVAGKQIPNQYAGMADSAYTSPTIDGKPNPYYTGATYEQPTQTAEPSSPLANFDYGSIKSGDTYTAPDGTLRRKK